MFALVTVQNTELIVSSHFQNIIKSSTLRANLEDITLNKIRQGKYYMISHISNLKNRTHRKRLVVAGVGVERKQGNG